MKIEVRSNGFSYEVKANITPKKEKYFFLHIGKETIIKVSDPDKFTSFPRKVSREETKQVKETIISLLPRI